MRPRRRPVYVDFGARVASPRLPDVSPRLVAPADRIPDGVHASLVIFARPYTRGRIQSLGRGDGGPRRWRFGGNDSREGEREEERRRRDARPLEADFCASSADVKF